MASDNPVKTRAALRAFESMFHGETFELKTVAVTSGVADQPLSSEETLLGATQRSQRARESEVADYWVGIEGGIEDTPEGMTAFAWVVVRTSAGVGRGRTATFSLPPAVAELVRGGMELGDADDVVFDRENSKQKEGAVGLLTGNALDRARLYEQAVIAALIPFKNPKLYT